MRNVSELIGSDRYLFLYVNVIDDLYTFVSISVHTLRVCGGQILLYCLTFLIQGLSLNMRLG